MGLFLSKLFNRNNTLALVTVLVGVLGIFGVPQKIGLTNEQIIMGLLSFIAVEALIVNIGLLEGISSSVEHIRSKTVSPSLDNIISTREKIFELSDFTANAREITIFGVSLESLVMSQANLFIRLVNQECSIRFVITDPSAPFLGSIDLNMHNYVGQNVQVANIRAGLMRIAQLYRSLPTNQRNLVEARTYAGIPFLSGIRILTRNNKNNTLWVSFYSYGGTTGDRRGLLITSDTAPDNFRYYNDSVDKLWNGSVFIDIENFSY